MNYKKGKKIESREEFVKGRKYYTEYGIDTFKNHDRETYVEFEETSWWLFSCHNFHEAIPDISIEVYEEVLFQFNEFRVSHGKVNLLVQDFLNHKFKPDLPGDYTGWVKDEEAGKWLMYFKNGEVQYGFDSEGDFDNSYFFDIKTLEGNEEPATPEEVYPRLKKHARENQGLVEGVEVECLSDDVIETLTMSKSTNYLNEVSLGELWMGSKDGSICMLLNSKGEWAKPIEKKVTPEQVEAKADELMELVKGLTQNK